MDTKKCCMCQKVLLAECFKANKKRKDGLQSQCIECQRQYRREHYLKNREKYIDKSSKWRIEFRRWWKDYKSQFSCKAASLGLDPCNESHPACIDFHHLGDKEEAVSVLVALCNKEKLLQEIEKCVPICSNCHRKIHWQE